MGRRANIKRVAIRDGQVFDLVAHGIAGGAVRLRSGDGWVLFPLSVQEGKPRIHFTVLVQDGRLTVHATNQETGGHAHLLDLDLVGVIQRLCDPALLEAFEQRLRQIYYLAPGPESLQAIGTSWLEPMLVNEDAYRLLPDGTLEALSPRPSADLAALWRSSSDFAWIAFDGRDEPIGVAYPRWADDQVHVFFVYFEDMERVFGWLAMESGLSEAFKFRQQLGAERQLRRLQRKTSE